MNKKNTSKPATGMVATKKNGSWADKIINISAILLFVGAFTWMIIAVVNDAGSDKTSTDAYIASLPSTQDTIAHNKICMVDDVYQGDYPTVEYKLINKTYYGCSQKATRDLAQKAKLRVAIDPVTNEEIDKAIALIAVHPKRDGKVLYFKSVETFNMYKKTGIHETELAKEKF